MEKRTWNHRESWGFLVGADDDGGMAENQEIQTVHVSDNQRRHLLHVAFDEKSSRSLSLRPNVDPKEGGREDVFVSYSRLNKGRLPTNDWP